MSNFNQFFKSTGAKTMVDKFLRGVDLYHNTKLATLDFEVIEEPHPASYYVENGLTATFKVKVYYTTTASKDILVSEFEVPREVGGVFVIEGSYRTSTNVLGRDFDCRFRMTGTGTHTIQFDYDRVYNIDKKVLNIKRTNPETGNREKPLDIPFDKIDNAVNDVNTREYLRLTKEQIRKLQIKLDLDYKPEFITKQLINECLEFGDDRAMDLIIDKTIESVPASFNKYLYRGNNRGNFYGARRRITSYWTKNGKFQDQLNVLTTLCFRFWKGGEDVEESKEIRIPPGINSINLDSLTQKIQISKTEAYNHTFADLIDLADTPINQNVNLQNSLNVACHIEDDKVLYDVYTKDFKKVTIEYMDYLNSKVVASESVDYETKTLIPDEDGKVKVKYRMKRITVPVEEIDLIDLHPDNRLSVTTRRIPFVNFTDSVRISMGTSMLKQTIPVINAERPLVDTGNVEDPSTNVLSELFTHEEGKVKDITEDEVIVELPDKKSVVIPRRTAIQSTNDVTVYTEPKVKVGQKIKKGDVIVGAVEQRPDTYNYGVNSLVLFHAYHGLVNNDALVISKSYAERIASYSIIDLLIDVKNNGAVSWIAPIGTEVKTKDPLITINKAIRLDEINRTLSENLGSLIKDGSSIIPTEYIIQDHLRVPNNIESAVVSDILIQENKNPVIPKSVKSPDLTYSHTSELVFKEYEKTKNRQVIYDKYPEYIAADTLDPIDLSQKNYKVVYTIRVRLIKYAPAVVGEKITSRYGGKGLVAKIIDDEKMPKIVNKATGKKESVSVIMNPYSTVNRKIPAIIMESSLGLIAHKIRDMVEDYKRTKTGQKKIKPLLAKYYPGRFDNMEVEDIIQLHNTQPIQEVYYFNVGSYSSYTPDKINEWMKELGLDSQFDVLMPETELTDLDELKENLSEEEFKKVETKMSNNFIKVDRPLMAGYMTLERLYHIPSYSARVTSSVFGKDVNLRRDEPVHGFGRYRKLGQKIGEMELSVLLARNSKKFIEHVRGETAVEDNQVFLNNLLGLGLTVSDDRGYNQGGSNLKSDLNSLKAKFRKKNNL